MELCVRRRGAGLALALAVGTLIAGCGDDDVPDATGEGQPEAQPAPDVSTFQEGDFGDIPLPPRATPVGERSENDGVVTQSFEVRNSTPEEILDFYAGYFDDAQVVEPPEVIGTESARGQWEVDDRQLTIAAQRAPLLDDNPGVPEVLSQLSLSLAPAGAETSPS